MDNIRGPWGPLFRADLIGGKDVADRTQPGVADIMFCPSQTATAFGQPNNNNRANYQASYHFPPDSGYNWRVRKIHELKKNPSFIADVFLYSSSTHEDKGIKVSRIDGSAMWFGWPQGIPMWPVLWRRYSRND